MSEGLKSRYILGYDIGGTKIATCLANVSYNDSKKKYSYKTLASTRIKGGSLQGPNTAVKEMIEAGEKLLATNNLTISDLTAIGLCAPGPVDIANGLMLASPNMPLWDKIPVVKSLEKEFNCPVHFQNDANGGVLAEALFGNSSGKKDILYLTMSTGIGAGVVSNGMLVEGKSSLGTELGHIVLDINGPDCGCGLKGCFEAFCGGKSAAMQINAIAQNDPQHPFNDLVSNDKELDLSVITKAAANGHKEALVFWEDYCYRLAQGIGASIMSFNPEVVVLGTIAHHAGDLLMDRLKTHLPKFCWPELIADCTITTSSLGTDIGELSGVATAIYNS